MKVYVFQSRIKFITFIEKSLTKISGAKYELTDSGDLYCTANSEYLGNIWNDSTICLDNAEIVCLN